MPCYHPWKAYQKLQVDPKTGKRPVVIGTPRGVYFRTLEVPCGKCIGCKRQRVRAWAVRCLHEAQMHKENCFVTLTFDDAHLSKSVHSRREILFYL